MPFADLGRFGQKFRRRMRVEAITARLGDRDGDGQIVYVPGRPTHAYVREPQAAGWGPPVARRINGVINPTEDRFVILGYDESGELVIMGRDVHAMAASGGQPAKQPGDPNTAVSPWLYQDKFVTLLSYAYTTTSGGPSTDIGVRGWLYIRSGTLTFFPGGRIDAASFIPSAGNHRVVSVFLKSDNTLELIGSTAKSIVDPLTYTVDVQETLDNATAGSVPIWAWILKDNQSAITDSDKWLDLRNLVNDPEAAGGGAPDDAEYIIRVADAGLPNAQVLGALDTGQMRVTTTTGVVSSLKDNIGAATAPTVNDDSGDGYSVGSRWYDTTNDQEYVCLDATVTAAVWVRTTQVLSTPLSVSNGGTGRATLDNGKLLYGLGTAQVGELSGTNQFDYPYYVSGSGLWLAGRPDIIADSSLSGVASATINSFTANWRELEVIIFGRSTVAAGFAEIRLTLNNDTTATNYSTQYVSGVGATASAAARLGTVASVIEAYVPGATASSDYHGVTVVRIPRYSGTGFKRPVLWQSNLLTDTATATYQGSGYYVVSGAITRLDLTLVSGNFSANSRIIVRGIY